MIPVLDREAGRWLTAATVEKFASSSDFLAARSLIVAAGQRAYRQAEVEWLRSPGSCTFCGTPEAAQHEGRCPLYRFRPMPGGNLAAWSDIRDLIEHHSERLFSIEDSSGVLLTYVHADPILLDAAASSHYERLLLAALAIEKGQALGAANLLLNEGINELWELVTFDSSTSSVRWNASNARIGVGNSATAAAATDTALLGGSSQFKAMVSGFPTFGTSQKATWKSQYDSGEAEFSWQEWSIDNGNTRNKNLNRKVEPLGTKPAGTTWTLQVECSLS